MSTREEKIQKIQKDVEKEAKEAAKQGSKWFTSVLAFASVVYLINAFILYSGTMLFPPKFQPAKIYGMVDGPHPHLQRTAGVLLAIVAVINTLPIFFRKNLPIIGTALIVNILFVVHYMLETYYFWALRVEFMTIMFIVIILNGYWAAKEFLFNRMIQKIKEKMN
eukprot:gene4444-7819_t